jgi:putative membrane protein
MQILLRWALGAVALYVTIIIAQHLGIHMWLAPGLIGAEAAVIFVLVLGIANAVIRPIVGLLTLPLTCLTFGLFSFVINGLMFWLAGVFVPGFHERGFVAPLFGSIVMSLVSGALNALVITDKERAAKKK